MKKLTKQFSIDEAALILGVSRATIYNWIAAGTVEKDPNKIIEYGVECAKEKLQNIYDGIELFTQKATPA